ncbi:cysteine proteinase [Rhodofomes roseus]|uniref:ubiquitinyl hydrolase 1 n=1 Tax=Rhodofomes roseus TaxID=34475 RepID=A0ABQ8K1J5_9APHY|nr:cysteine proteinase [Rhodofomes roseus]KAH9830534.1 cysteine proteinase [Rhodofomes roseus]
MTNEPQTPQRSDDAHDAEPPSPSTKRSQSKYFQPTNASLTTPISSSTFYGSERAGSSHTGYIAPTTSPYREPEVVEDRPAPSQPKEDSTLADWSAQQASSSGWETQWSGHLWPETSGAHKIAIDGRDEFQELNWSNLAVHDSKPRPGSGMLPPLLADELHNPDHPLYSVNVTTQLPPTTPNGAQLAPSQEEARTAIPHARSYYCAEHNGWVLLWWGTSTVLPPLARTIDNLPDPTRRKWTQSCVGDGEQPFGQVNATHHWHRYERAIDSRYLSTPFEREEETLLDLYLCCQCTKYCMVSEVLPGVIPQDVHQSFVRDRWSHPPLGRTPKASVLAGWETMLTIIENRLWKDEQRALPVTRPRFQQKLGWNDTVRKMFELLEFPIDRIGNTVATSTDNRSTTEELGLQPPNIDPATPEGKRIRAKLLRAWAEISAWLAIYRKSNGDLGGYSTQILHVDATEVREMYQMEIGAHVNQIPRGLLPDALVNLDILNNAWKALGMTPSSYSWELLGFAYLAQCRCDPLRTTLYFTYFCQIVQTLANVGEASPDLQQLIHDERKRYRFTLDDFRESVALLGFGKDGELGVEFDDDVDEKFILEAWRNARRRTWADTAKGGEIRMRLNDALKIIADTRNSQTLNSAWEREKGSGMTPETAYSTLEVPKDVDETMLITIYAMRVEDQPSQTDRMKEALSVITDVTNSERLRKFLETGMDPGDANQTSKPEMPRGLNQLGNTCYLNSLLQYLYTIKDLREAVAPFAESGDEKMIDDSKFTDDDLKRHRVGGRLVTRREISRSKKFVRQLASLFWNLEYCEIPAVTPSIDLAKLALVTSQDEEEDDISRPGTEGSNDTDATLVEDVPSHSGYDPPSPPPLASPTESVLGKRHRGSDDMDVDMRSSPPETARDNDSHSAAIAEAVASSSKLQMDADVDQSDARDLSDGQVSKAPPLPKRPRPTDDSVMMFGRQHDVSECMDNCIFQIETALLDFQEMAGAEDDKTSIVKRLFFGKKRQRLTPLSATDDTRHKSSIHEKEDLFSHLHVNVSDEGFDLYDGLARYFDDVVEFDGVKKRMEVSLVDLPPLLQIQLQRAQFDRETQQAYKSQAYVKFGETLYVDRFLDSADGSKKAESKAIQAELSVSRERIQRLTQDKHAPFAPALGAAADFLATQQLMPLPEATEDLVSALQKEQEFVTRCLEDERSKAARLKTKIEDIWKDDTTAAYELTSVFIHRGSSPSWGHYFFYSRNLPNNPDQWFKYNDSDVTVVSKEEVLADTTGSTANPYMLVFARKGLEAIRTVHRFDPATLQDG